MKRVIIGVVISLCAIIVSLGIIEVCLRVAGSFRDKKLASAKSIDKDSFLIYCFGDSFTYGIGGENGEGYPEKLQGIFKTRYPDKKIRVVNFGVPGSNSKQTLDYFKYILDSSAYPHPNLVILMTGMNDWWNVSDNRDIFLYYKLNPFITKCYIALARLKVVKLLTVCFVNKGPMRNVRFDAQTGIANPDDPEARSRMGERYLDIVRVVYERNINDFVDLARSRGIEIAFSQYPKGFMLDASLEEIARSKGVAMVYNNRRLLRESGERSLDEYFSGEFSYSHPNDKGYAVMADEIYNHLRMSGYFRSVYI